MAPDYHGSGKLLNQVAIVTGGDSGIGRAVSVLFAREGADVAIVYLPVEQSDAEETADAVNHEGRQVLLLPGDVTQSVFCHSVIEKVVDRFGKIDILVNNAAYQQTQDRLEDITDDDWELTFRTNIFAYFYMAKSAIKVMREGSNIINCGSRTGLEGSKSLIDYASSKGAIHAFTKSLALKISQTGKYESTVLLRDRYGRSCSLWQNLPAMSLSTVL